ncbi:MAG: TetR/AcrR family transcriptional regulator [Rhodospirillaceae bacterium]
MTKAKVAAKAKRVRRSPEDAKRLILDAAEASMGADGPAGLRLQDVAKAAGVSHPTILHHFGSREGLVHALNARSLEELKTAVVGNMGPGPGGLRATFKAYRDGLAQRIVWLMQSGAPPPAGGAGAFDAIVQALQAERVKHAKPGSKPDIEDTRMVAHLTAITAFGDALMGRRLRQAYAPKNKEAADRFEKWFGELIILYLQAKR